MLEGLFQLVAVAVEDCHALVHARVATALVLVTPLRQAASGEALPVEGVCVLLHGALALLRCDELGPGVPEFRKERVGAVFVRVGVGELMMITESAHSMA